MTFSRRGLLLALVQVLLVASLGAKLQLDRARLPRVWVKAAAVDPYLPIRGRYVAVRLEVRLLNPAAVDHWTGLTPLRGNLLVQDGHLAVETTPDAPMRGVWLATENHGAVHALRDSVLFFLPEHAPDPLAAARNGELWAEVTVPKEGLPRPIRLAIKRGDSFVPIEAK
jgi:hypothetical protein